MGGGEMCCFSPLEDEALCEQRKESSKRKAVSSKDDSLRTSLGKNTVIYTSYNSS